MTLEQIQEALDKGLTVLDEEGDKVVLATEEGFIVEGDPEFYNAPWLFKRFTIKEGNPFDNVDPDCHFFDEEKGKWVYAYSEELVKQLRKEQ